MMTNQTKPHRLLLIEDDQGHADLIQVSLEAHGDDLDINHVNNGAKANDYLRNQGEYAEVTRPDLVLLDLNSPKISWHEVLEQIKSDESLQSVPVVVLTTSANEQDISKDYHHNANSYLAKPVDFEKFQSMIHDLRVYWTRWSCNSV